MKYQDHEDQVLHMVACDYQELDLFVLQNAYNQLTLQNTKGLNAVVLMGM